MATPFGHALGGLAALQALPTSDRRRIQWLVVLGCVFFAIAPDFDFLPGVLAGKPALYHQGPSHSLGATLLAGAIGAILFRKALGSYRWGFAVAALAYSSHLVIDLFGPDTRLPYGVPILWPLSGEYFQGPFVILMGVRHSQGTDTALIDWLGNVFSFRNVLAIGLELVVIGPLLVLSVFLRRIRSGRNSARATDRG